MASGMTKLETDRAKKKPIQVIIKNGRPSAVILDIEDYQELLEKAQDADDLRVLERMRKRPLKFRKLEEFLSEQRGRV